MRFLDHTHCPVLDSISSRRRFAESGKSPLVWEQCVASKTVAASPVNLRLVTRLLVARLFVFRRLPRIAMLPEFVNPAVFGYLR